MRFNTQFVYLLGIETLTGAVVALGVLLILGMIHKFCSGFSHRQGIGWLGVLAFLIPVWSIGRWITHVWIPSYRYGAIISEITFYWGYSTSAAAAIVLAVWAVGVGAGMIFFAVKWRKLRRMLRRAVRVTDPSILFELEELQEGLGICKDVTVLYVSNLPSPGCGGVRKPYIVMNRESMRRENFHSVLCHELIHIKRNDIVFRHMLDLVSVIHWFNPCVHLFRLVMTKQIEYGCDMYAILQTGWRICSDDYMEAISHVIKKQKKNTSYVLPFGGRYEDTRRRIRYLKKAASPRLASSMAIMAAAFGVLMGASVTVYAVNQTATSAYVDWLRADETAAVRETEELDSIEVSLKEYTTQEEISGVEREISQKGSSVGICWTLDGGASGISKAFEGSAGDVLSSIIVPDGSASYEFGLMKPDGEIVWIHLDQDGYHEFHLDQNGAYRLVVKNNRKDELQLDVVMKSSFDSWGNSRFIVE